MDSSSDVSLFQTPTSFSQPQSAAFCFLVFFVAFLWKTLSEIHCPEKLTYTLLRYLHITVISVFSMERRFPSVFKKNKQPKKKEKLGEDTSGRKPGESTLDFDLPFLCRDVDPFDPHLGPAPPKFIYDYDHRAIQHMWPILECHSLSKQDYMVSLLNHLARYIPLRPCWERYMFISKPLREIHSLRKHVCEKECAYRASNV